MRWFVLLAVLGGILWTANWSYHHVDNAILITDIWKAERSPIEWGLVNFKDNQPVIYEYVGTKGFWNIFKGLWPIWTLFILSFFILVPLSIYIFNSLNNVQIAAAKEAQIEAEERARKAELDAKKYEQKAKSWAEERVNSAYQEQLSRVKKELEGEWDSFHKQKNQVLERESAIQNRERTAQQIEESAKERVDNIVEQYNQERDRFEAEMLDMARARDNAQAGYKRIKMKLDRKKNLSF
ncbi:hypothetical protein EXA16_16900 [Vibrio cincinnatiensis]|uniref:hypothetical protein n=1 Tax=Vibrio cincinnatiensis TaxID=675 RepID=UPI001EDE4945|nr:hypothetical protein [Vibrio cincinnatiensis]MCG3737993.1 hypothetical protein [Vibrio cincinnatiensis]